MRVVWTEHAYSQLDEAMAFIARDRPETAMAWLEHILDESTSLAEFPDRGRAVPETSRQDVRELIVNPYRLVYRRDAEWSRSRWWCMGAAGSTRRMWADGWAGQTHQPDASEVHRQTGAAPRTGHAQTLG